MIDNRKDRKEYWEKDYLEYWKNRTSKEIEVIKDDAKPADADIFEFYLEKMKIERESKILDLGCGFGRLFPVLKKHNYQIYGIDISTAMIEKAKQRYGKICCELIVAEAENFRFEGDYFDGVICWAVFDALFQKEALIEINRVLKIEGIAMITGKNDNYRDDDEKALIAEINARKKGHPNYFTDLRTLLDNLSNFGFKLNLVLYFEKRGDFSENKFVINMPSFFYEYLIFIEKIDDVKLDDIHDLTISEEYSKTFKRVGGGME